MNTTTIDWCTIRDDQGEIVKRGMTWNPLVGCTARCGATAEKPEGWCYAAKFARRFGDAVCDQYPDRNNPAHANLDPHHSLCWNFFPHLHAERLDQPLHRRKPAGIFVGSQADMWDPNVPQKWRDRAFEVMFDAPQHTYWALTKQPQNFTNHDHYWFDQAAPWIGVSVTGQEDLWKIGPLLEIAPGYVFVSFEPLLGPISLAGIKTRWLEWVIIGAMTGPGAIAPEREWVFELAEQCREAGVPVYAKNNLRPVMGEEWVDVRQRHPAAMGEA